jgi:glyoxylase-like metal-dependent hydrolase (beta-lactamase superfamily II)
MSATDTATLPDYAPLPETAIGPALNEQGYYVGRVERNLYYVTDGTYMCAFLTTSDGVVVLDAPPTLGNNIQRAIDEIAAANGVSNKVEHLVYSHHHSDHVGAASLFDKNVTRIGHEETRSAPSRSVASGSTSPGRARITRPTTSSSTCPATTR